MIVVAGVLFGLSIAEVLGPDTAETVGVIAALTVLGIVVPLWPLRWWLLVAVPAGYVAYWLLGFAAMPLINRLYG